MSQQIVEQVKADLITRGIIPAQQTTNEHAVEITGRVAWILRNQGARLIIKHAPQNRAKYGNVEVGIDAIQFPNGFVDCLVSAGPPRNVNGPTWAFTPGTANINDASKYVAPFDMDLALLPTVPTEPTTPVDEPMKPPTPVDAVGIEARLQALEGAIVHLGQVIVRLLETSSPGTVVMTPPLYDIPYDIQAPWPIGKLKGTITATPRNA